MQAVDQRRSRQHMGTGRRKSSTRVRLVPGNGLLIVNGKPGDLYFNSTLATSVAKAPLETLGLENEYILVKAHGGGLTGQSDSIRLGVALCAS